MTEAKSIVEEASKWPVLKDYRSVLEKLSLASELDMTDSQNHTLLDSMYANYYARLNTFAARFDRPEARVYLKLSKICNPTVFKDSISPAIENDHPLISRPATEIGHPLYTIARETQQMMPGSIYLRDVSKLFKEGEIPPNFNPVVVEFALETKFKQKLSARIPIILVGNPMSDRFIDQNIGLLQRVVEGLKLTESKAKVEINHMPSSMAKPKELKKVYGEEKILDWPMSYRNAWLGSPIAAALLGNTNLGEEQTYFESISVSCGQVEKKWQGADKSILFSSFWPSHDVWKWWSFKNTIYQLRNIATTNTLKESVALSADILSLQNIRFDSERNANLAVHMPVLLSAAFSEVMSRGIEIGFAEREGNEQEIARQRREQEDRFWETYLP